MSDRQDLPAARKWLRFAVPFGRYIGTTESEAGAHQVLVGRETQRAQFSDMLITHGPDGAFLVTGQRGAGKTTFVNESLRQYERDLLSRVLRSNVGRSVYWDRIAHVSIALFLFAILLIAHELLTILMSLENIHRIRYPQSGRFLFWMVMSPFIAICGAPIIYTMRALAAVFAHMHERNSLTAGRRRFGSPPAIWAFGITGLFIVLSVAASSPAAIASITSIEALKLFQVTPDVTMSRLLLFVVSFAWIIQQFSVRRAPITRPVDGPWYSTHILKRGLKYLAALAAASLVMPIISALIIWGQQADPTEHQYFQYGLNLAMSHSIMAALLVLQGGWERLDSERNTKTWFLIGAVTCFVIALSLGEMARQHDQLSWTSSVALLCGPLLIAVGHVGFIRRKNLNESPNLPHVFVPQPNIALVTKAIASCVLGTHLLQPVLVSLYARALDSGPQPPFVQLQPGTWLLAVMLVAIAIARLEYSWIVSPYGWLRSDQAHDPSHPAVNDDNQLMNAHDDPLFLNAQLAHNRWLQHTFYWQFYSNWLPVIVVPVNLGSDRLEHNQVIRSMLAGLRERYQQRFVSGFAAVPSITRALRVAAILVLATTISEYTFRIPPPDTLGVSDHEYQEIVAEITSGNIPPETLKHLPPDSGLRALAHAPRLLKWLYFPIISSHAIVPQADTPWWLKWWYAIVPQADTGASEQRFWNNINQSDYALCTIVPCATDHDKTTTKPFEGPVIRVYNVLILLALFALGSLALRRLRITPYPSILKQIDQALDRFTAKIATVDNTGALALRSTLATLELPNQVRTANFEQADIHDTELSLSQILHDIRSPRSALFPSRHLHLPAPEVIFVFDELDKVGASVARAPGGLAHDQTLHLALEHQRSEKIRQLFSEMKSLLSSAHARFIMIGGRNLHDEWLGDHTARLPLLTNIFSGSIYLPSLLVDSPGPSESSSWDRQVRNYLYIQHARARQNYISWIQDRGVPAFGLTERLRLPNTFTQSRTPQSLRQSGLRFVGYGGEAIERRVLDHWQAGLIDDFVNFLTFRSMGNPKKMQELLESFVLPIGRAGLDESQRAFGHLKHTQHTLVFDDDAIFRVQLVSYVYQQLRDALEALYVQRDDKLVSALFYLTDFMFKFHRRAFTWANLERVDEFLHIHRAPDSRTVLASIVEEWSESVLHPILNGLYQFRFRSDMACEIDYISRRSKEEMAAFNFTLDESQALKATYHDYIRSIGDTSSYDLLIGLGELHEFDQEYDVARQHYQDALARLDLITANLSRDGRKSIDVILDGSPLAHDFVRQHMTWATTRLRVMLQLGLTFELSRNLERASVEYEDARTFSRVLLNAYLDENTLPMQVTSAGAGGELLPATRTDSSPGRKHNRLHALQHLDILFQAAFAAAWTAEKMTQAVDTSIRLVERELHRLRNRLPFVREGQLKSRGPVQSGYENLSLSMAKLHFKAGDLYFFKGRQYLDPEDVADLARRGGEGYLLGAHFHYATGLHDIRRFNKYRREDSGNSLNIWHLDNPDSWATIEPGGWSDIIFRATGSGLGDLADAALARVSFFRLTQHVRQVRNSEPTAADVRATVLNMRHAVCAWLEGEGNGEFECPAWTKVNGAFRAICDLELGSLPGWLGKIRPTGDGAVWSQDGIYLTFDEDHNDLQRLFMALLFSTTAAWMLERAGYPGDAARDMIQVANTVEQYLWWFKVVSEFAKPTQDPKAPIDSWPSLADRHGRVEADLGCATQRFLLDFAIYALQDAQRLYAVMGSNRANSTRYPLELLYSACSLGLLTHNIQALTSHREQLLLIIADCGFLHSAQSGAAVGGDASTEFEMIVNLSLQRYRFPALARIRGLRLLLDFLAFRQQSDTSSIRDEFMRVAEQLQSPLHCTPLQVGSTIAHDCLLGTAPATLRKFALRQLRESLDVTSMQRAYYNAISNLYYLYDDFNDSQIHYNHAIQMAGYEYARLLMALLENPATAPSEVGSEKAGSPEPRDFEDGPVEIGVAKVGSAKIGVADVGVADFEQTTTKRISEVESSLSEMRQHWEHLDREVNDGRKKTTQLASDIHSYSWLASTGADFAAARIVRYVPFRVYVGDPVPDVDTLERILQALRDLGDAVDLEPADELPDESGSWFKRIFLKTKTVASHEQVQDVLAKAKTVVETIYLDKPQAEVTGVLADAAAKLIAALSAVPGPCCGQAGSLLVVKHVTSEGESSIYFKTLTSMELKRLEENAAMLRHPADILDWLESMSSTSARPGSGGDQPRQLRDATNPAIDCPAE